MTAGRGRKNKRTRGRADNSPGCAVVGGQVGAAAVSTRRGYGEGCGCCCLCASSTCLGLQLSTWRWTLGRCWSLGPAAGKMRWGSPTINSWDTEQGRVRPSWGAPGTLCLLTGISDCYSPLRITANAHFLFLNLVQVPILADSIHAVGRFWEM